MAIASTEIQRPTNRSPAFVPLTSATAWMSAVSEPKRSVASTGMLPGNITSAAVEIDNTSAAQMGTEGAMEAASSRIDGKRRFVLMSTPIIVLPTGWAAESSPALYWELWPNFPFAQGFLYSASVQCGSLILKSR